MPTETVIQRAARRRRRAEARAEVTSYQDLTVLSPEEVGRLVHELRVHQIELEMQNEELVRTQVELEVSRTRYVDLYHLAPVGYLTLSERGLILEANLRAAALLRMPEGMLVRRLLGRFILPEDSDVYYRHHRQLFQSGEPQVCEVRLAPRRAGAYITWVRLEMAQAQDEEHQATVCRVVLTDITERQEMLAELRRYRDHLEGLVEERTRDLQAEIAERAAAQDALQRSEARLAAAERIARVGSWEQDLVTNELWWSDNHYRIFGLSPDMPPDNALAAAWDRICPDDRGAVEAAYARCKQTGETSGGALRIILPSGETRVLYGETEAVCNSAGQPVRIRAFVQDVTEQIAEREALRHSEASLAIAERIAHLGSWDRDLQTGEYHFSDELLRMFGLNPGDDPVTIRAAIWRSFHPDDFARLQAAYEHALKTGEPFDDAYRIILPSGETRMLHGRTEMIRDAEGRFVRIHGILQDITEQASASHAVRRRRRPGQS